MTAGQISGSLHHAGLLVTALVAVLHGDAPGEVRAEVEDLVEEHQHHHHHHRRPGVGLAQH